MALITATMPCAVWEARARAIARMSSVLPVRSSAAAARTSARTSSSVRFSRGRPRDVEARLAGSERRSRSTEGPSGGRPRPSCGSLSPVLRTRAPAAARSPSAEMGIDGDRERPAFELPGHVDDAADSTSRSSDRRLLHRADDRQHRPQHPSTHGVLRVVLELDGEVIARAEPVIGYMHRAAEARRVPRRPTGAGADEPARLDRRLQQRAGVDDRGRATRRDRGPGARAVDPRCSPSGTGSSAI